MFGMTVACVAEPTAGPLQVTVGVATTPDAKVTVHVSVSGWPAMGVALRVTAAHTVGARVRRRGSRGGEGEGG